MEDGKERTSGQAHRRFTRLSVGAKKRALAEGRKAGGSGGRGMWGSSLKSEQGGVKEKEGVSSAWERGRCGCPGGLGTWGRTPGSARAP